MNGELYLTDDERKQLIEHYETDALPDFIANYEEDAWYGYQIGDRMFDLNIWNDTDYGGTGDIQCDVYLCEPTDDDNWTTTMLSCKLWESDA